ncbi:MAG: DPP IV N-terminal domain-containing protein [Acidobacteria bacterium]|nr:DPP IV N-terminal domain-containing protein [Acidobacteriota bacterium]
MVRRASRLPVPTLVILLVTVASLIAVVAQDRANYAPAAVTAADYARAEKFLGPGVSGLVVGGSVTPAWLPDERFSYRSVTADGTEFVLVDPVRRTRGPAFDHAKLAATLSAAAGITATARELPFQSIELSADTKMVSFDAAKRRWSCDVAGAKCVATGDAIGGRGAGGRGRGGQGGRGGRGDAAAGVTSPDGKRAVFVRDWNLWVREIATNQEKPLTTDGAKNFGYATDNAGWAGSDRAIALWSPDSKKVATYQQDEREVGDMYLVDTRVGHPTLKAWKYPLPGDKAVAMLQRVIIDVDAARVTRLQMPPDYHRATLGDNFSLNDMKWSPDAAQLAFASTSRDHKQATVRLADAATGAVRTVFDETVPTHFESIAGWQVLWTTNEVIWSSQRDDWGQLYLYDLASGKLKSQITSGEGPVTEIARVDEKTRTIWFTALGREKGQDPYFRHAYRIGMDGKNVVSLSPDDGDHTAQLSPSGRFFIDTYSKPDVPPVVTLRDGDGKLVMPLERADISKLLATGWKPPTPITMKAADGKTDIYGLLFRPTSFDPSKKYAVVNNAYPGPQSGSTGSRTFSAARGDRQALAELGFIVVTIDGRGTPNRSKSFHDAYYGAMGRDNTLPDQVAGMKDLARRFPWIDLDRAGMWGHSGGGFIAADAMFRYPDFFKVGISESGNHDQRNYEDDWGERYQGLLVKNADGTDNYAAEANQTLAKNLKGKLLLAHGMMDNNVPPSNTMLVVEALIKANKDFDLLVLPNQPHGYGDQAPYMMRRRWDYFVKWLLGAEPPKEFLMQPAPSGGRGQ